MEAVPEISVKKQLDRGDCGVFFSLQRACACIGGVWDLCRDCPSFLWIYKSN